MIAAIRKMKKIILVVILVSQLLLASAWAQAFVIRDIQFQGLQRISPSTVENYLPVKRGQTLRPNQTGQILGALYKSGFFEHISLAKEGNTLIIHVVERPTIGQLKITGNSVIPTDKLTTVMKNLDVAEGRVYNPAVLEKIKQSLLNQYYSLGRYNARVDVDVTPMSRNRVMVKIDISEGLAAKIRRISIIGNKIFDESTLIKQMDLTTTGIITFFTQTDRYSEDKLDSSVDKIRGYYMDRGYLRFEAKSAQAQISPDRKSVYITIVIYEGQQYTVSRVDVTGMDLPVSKERLLSLIQSKPGEIFSRKKALDSEKAITTELGKQGYMFANVNLRPDINDTNHTVALTFNVNAGKRAYVRQVTFTDNVRTNDVVLRREVQQMEGAPASTTKLDESKQRLLLLPYIKETEMSVKPVPGVDDQVDVDYKVTEDSSAQASFKVGYSQVYRTIIGIGLNQKNFLGTGNTLGINFQRSKYEQLYNIDYTDPYYTADGISRSFNFGMSRVDPGGAGVDSGYTSNQLDLGVLYGIPVGQEENAFDRISAGVSYQNILIRLINGAYMPLSNQLNAFITDHGRHYQEADFKLGFSRDSRDRALLSTSGSLNTLFFDAYAPLDSNSVAFYTINYAGRWYKPINDQFIFLTKANLGYGNGFHGVSDFPFFKNYYAGGIDTVRGYQGYSLGPWDSNGKPYGANMLANASISLIFPNYISDNLRTSVFVDGGNVYSSRNNRDFGGASTNSGPPRYSTGIEADWISPFGPIELSLAQPLNRRPHDERETFQFAMGANF